MSRVGGGPVGAMVPVPGRPTSLDKSRARSYCAGSRCGWGCLDIFSLVCHFSFLSPSLWETARLKYCFKGPLSPKQQTNQRRVTRCCHWKLHCVPMVYYRAF